LIFLIVIEAAAMPWSHTPQVSNVTFYQCNDNSGIKVILAFIIVYAAHPKEWYPGYVSAGLRQP